MQNHTCEIITPFFRVVAGRTDGEVHDSKEEKKETGKIAPDDNETDDNKTDDEVTESTIVYGDR